MSCDKYARMIIKTGSGVPTIPVSADHRNGDWLDTDIYEGEQYLDTDTGIVYTRNGSDIVNVGSTASYKVYRATLTQTGTNAPVATVLENTLGGTLVWSRLQQGEYRATLAGAFPTATKVDIYFGASVPWATTGGSYPTIDKRLPYNTAYRATANDIYANTFDLISTAAEDDCLLNTSIEIRVYA